MSTELGSYHNVSLTEFSGGIERGVCLQINGDASRSDRGYVQVTKDEARWLATRLRRWAAADLRGTQPPGVAEVMRALLLVTRPSRYERDVDDSLGAAWVLVDYIESLEEDIAGLRATLEADAP